MRHDLVLLENEIRIARHPGEIETSVETSRRPSRSDPLGEKSQTATVQTDPTLGESQIDVPPGAQQRTRKWRDGEGQADLLQSLTQGGGPPREVVTVLGHIHGETSIRRVVDGVHPSPGKDPQATEEPPGRALDHQHFEADFSRADQQKRRRRAGSHLHTFTRITRSDPRPV
jgi:hypothetical protein